IKDASVIDVFAGVGALGLEALSRGAAHATFIDNGGDAIKYIHANAEKLCDATAFTVLKLDATRLPPPPLKARAPCAIAFLDPPYNSGLAVPALLSLAKGGWIGEGAVLVVEIAALEPFEAPLGFTLVDERTYGAARVIFLRRTA
ncbi:MAG: RsmD family RNA methyltransferase, partial [Rhodospirillales bacterium]|nr:RsmD family RNA methyltransferase [Rhodospirillales bacterium]